MESPSNQKIRRVSVMTHRYPAGIDSAIEKIVERAKPHGVEIGFDRSESLRHSISEVPGVTIFDSIEQFAPDVSLVLGGDGSVLHSLRTFVQTGVPTFGINYGTIGFLTTVESEQLITGIDQAIKGEFDRISLPALRLEFGGQEFVGVNDIAVDRPRDARVSELAYSIADVEVGKVRCDGVVVATPAGSTGYNLANYGPILAWGTEGYVVSFIAPHTLTARAMVGAPGDILKIKNVGQRDANEVLVDGRMVGELPVGESATVRFEANQTVLAQMPGSSFYSRFHQKFGLLAN